MLAKMKNVIKSNCNCFILIAHHPDRPPPSFYCNDCYSKLIKEGQADPEMFEDINHPISQVIRHILNCKSIPDFNRGFA